MPKRIERLFAHVKRFRIIANSNLGPDTHSLIVRFVFLCEHIVLRQQRITSCPCDCATFDVAPGQQCVCNWRTPE
jgi:hypothetical protein